MLDPSVTLLSLFAENRTSALANVWNKTLSTPNKRATNWINLDQADMSVSIPAFILRNSSWNSGRLNASATNSCRLLYPYWPGFLVCSFANS